MWAPMRTGSFHPDAVKTLEKIGDWLALNGEAIYETRPYLIAAEGPTVVEDADYDTQRIAEQLDKGAAADVRSNVLTGRDYRFTTRGETLYVIAMGWRRRMVPHPHPEGKRALRKEGGKGYSHRTEGAADLYQGRRSSACQSSGTETL